MEYPNVKNAHIVPRTYLANWAVDGKVGVWLLPAGKRLPDKPIEKVGTRRRFYQRTRPSTGDKINDIEWSLGQAEAAATPLLRSFDERWPLSTPEKVQLAELHGSRRAPLEIKNRRSSIAKNFLARIFSIAIVIGQSGSS